MLLATRASPGGAAEDHHAGACYCITRDTGAIRTRNAGHRAQTARLLLTTQANDLSVS